MNIKLDDFLKNKLNDVSFDYKPEYWDEMKKKLENEGGGGTSSEGFIGGTSALLQKLAFFVGTVIIVGSVIYFINTGDNVHKSDKTLNDKTIAVSKKDKAASQPDEVKTQNVLKTQKSEDKSVALVEPCDGEATTTKIKTDNAEVEDLANKSKNQTESAVDAKTRVEESTKVVSPDEAVDKSKNANDNILIVTGNSRAHLFYIEQYIISPTVSEKIRNKFEAEIITSMMRNTKPYDLGILSYKLDKDAGNAVESNESDVEKASRSPKAIDKADNPKNYRPMEKPVKHVFNKKKSFWNKLGFRKK